MVQSTKTVPVSVPVQDNICIDFVISSEKILSIIRTLNPDKAHGWDDISVRMIKLCDKALVFPLKLIFENFLRQGLFPEKWKKVNVVLVHKKNEKNLKRKLSTNFPSSDIWQDFRKFIFDTLYQHLESNSLLNSNQSGFRPGDSTVNQLLSIVNSISQAFDCNPALDVRSVYRDISKAFDRVWHEGLLYKLRRNGISGRLLLLIESFLANRQSELF